MVIIRKKEQINAKYQISITYLEFGKLDIRKGIATSFRTETHGCKFSSELNALVYVEQLTKMISSSN